MAPFGGEHMDDPKAFFHKGPARDYRAELTPEQIERSTGTPPKSWAATAPAGWRPARRKRESRAQHSHPRITVERHGRNARVRRLGALAARVWA